MTDKLDPGTEAAAPSDEPKAWWMDHVRELVMGPGGPAKVKPPAEPAEKPVAKAAGTIAAAKPEAPGADQPPPPSRKEVAVAERGAESTPQKTDSVDRDLQERALEQLASCSERVEDLAEELRSAVRGLSDLTSAMQTHQNDLGFDAEPVEGDAGVVGLLGSTSCVPTWAVLELLSANRKSGTLRVVGDNETFTLEILEGDVVHASSDRSTQEQLLGSILVARDKIGVEQLDDFYKRFTPGADGPGDGESLVSTEDLKSALEAQVQELFNRVNTVDTGAYSFFEGERSNVEQRIRMNVTRLLLESARTADELDEGIRDQMGDE